MKCNVICNCNKTQCIKNFEHDELYKIDINIKFTFVDF